MKVYKVRVLQTAEADIDALADFLFENLSREGAYRYLEFMKQEVKSLSIYANCFAETHSKTIRDIHPKARRMVIINGCMCSISKKILFGLTGLFLQV